MKKTKVKEPLGFKYIINVEYDMEYNHENDYSGDMCRCGRITNARIESIDYFKVANAIIDYLEVYDDILGYCIQRIVAGFQPKDFSINICGGYYGQELQNVTLKDMEIFVNLLSAKNPIEFILEHEYSHVLSRLKDKKWYFKKVNVSDIEFGGNMYKLDKKMIEYYKKNTNDLNCLCEKIGNKFHLIDGRHRLTAAKNKIGVIYCEET